MLDDLDAIHETLIAALKVVHALLGTDLNAPLTQILPTTHVQI